MTIVTPLNKYPGRQEKNVKAARIAVYHRDCFASESTERFPELQLEQASPVTHLFQDKKEVRYKCLWRVYAPDAGYLSRYLGHLREIPQTFSLQILRKTETSALILPTVRGPSSSYGTVVEQGAVYANPVVVQNGLEIHSVVSENPEHLKQVLDELSSLGEVRMLGVSGIRADHAMGLTERQALALRTALSGGYYAWPRGVRLTDLAQKAGITRRGFQERLRKAEAKVFPKLLADLLSQNRRERPPT